MTDTAQRIALGVDVGGTGIKAAPVDLADGRLVGDRLRIDTPRPATPDRVVDVVRQLVAAHHWTGSVGVCVPAVVQRGVVRTAANIAPAIAVTTTLAVRAPREMRKTPRIGKTSRTARRLRRVIGSSSSGRRSGPRRRARARRREGP
ncbi:MAG: ROK family protein, partial [Ilumatobacteraceae bacterium]